MILNKQVEYNSMEECIRASMNVDLLNEFDYKRYYVTNIFFTSRGYLINIDVYERTT